MPRIIKRAAHGPAKHTTASGEVFSICRCGLSRNEHGLCDTSHKKTLDEDESKLYCYDENQNREEVADKEECEGCCGSCCH